MSEPCVEPASTPETAASADDLPGLPRPFQYRLRTMFAAVAILSMLFAVMDAVGMVWSVVLVWFLLLAVAHVTANAWGSRTRERAVAVRTDDTQRIPPSLESPRLVPWGDAARLRQTTRLGWPMIALTVAGALAGGALASTALMLLSHPRVGYAGVVVGTLSAATVSGFLAFLTSSFVEVAGRAWQEAAHGAVPPVRGSP